MASGRLKFFNTSKGYGFIEPDDGSKDVFIHISAFPRPAPLDLQEGQRVSYQVEANPRTGKDAAANARVL